MRNLILKYFPLPSSILRNVLGTRNLGDILSEREAIASEMQEGLDEATDPWGVLVERVEVVHVDDLGLLDDDRLLDEQIKTPIDYHYQRHQHHVKDVRVPENLQRAMAAEAEAARNARAKVNRIKMTMMMMIMVMMIRIK